MELELKFDNAEDNVDEIEIDEIEELEELEELDLDSFEDKEEEEQIKQTEQQADKKIILTDEECLKIEKHRLQELNDNFEKINKFLDKKREEVFKLHPDPLEERDCYGKTIKSQQFNLDLIEKERNNIKFFVDISRRDLEQSIKSRKEKTKYVSYLTAKEKEIKYSPTADIGGKILIALTFAPIVIFMIITLFGFFPLFIVGFIVFMVQVYFEGAIIVFLQDKFGNGKKRKECANEYAKYSVGKWIYNNVLEQIKKENFKGE